MESNERQEILRALPINVSEDKDGVSPRLLFPRQKDLLVPPESFPGEHPKLCGALADEYRVRRAVDGPLTLKAGILVRDAGDERHFERTRER